MLKGAGYCLKTAMRSLRWLTSPKVALDRRVGRYTWEASNLADQLQPRKSPNDGSGHFYHSRATTTALNSRKNSLSAEAAESSGNFYHLISMKDELSGNFYHSHEVAEENFEPGWVGEKVHRISHISMLSETQQISIEC